MAKSPLNGIRVLDLTRLLPGPVCTLFLADLGAEVIKVEEPLIGDYARNHPPKKNQMSGAFLQINRNKKSVTLDLAKTEDRDKFYKLVKKADVVVESFRPGVAKKLKIDYPALKKKNSKLIYCSITGYGQKGPMADEAGHDINYLALSGLLEQMGGPTAPSLINFQIADLSGSLVSAIGILSALFDLQRGGPGRYIDISLMQSALSLAALPFSFWQTTGAGAERGKDILSGGIPAYNIYQTQDSKFMAVGALEKKFWDELCAVLGRPDLKKFGTHTGESGEKTREELAQIFKSNTQSYWTKKFSSVEACVSPVHSFEEAFEFLKKKEMIVKAKHPTEGDVWQLSNPIKMSGYKFKVKQPAPGLGQDNKRIFEKS